MLETDAAYIAGLIDGDGHIGIENVGNNYKSPRITIANTNKDVLEWCLKTIGLGNISKNKFENTLHKKQLYTWYLSSRKNIMELLNQIYPYLKIKRMKALEIINFTIEKEEKYRTICGDIVNKNIIEMVIRDEPDPH